MNLISEKHQAIAEGRIDELVPVDYHSPSDIGHFEMGIDAGAEAAICTLLDKLQEKVVYPPKWHPNGIRLEYAIWYVRNLTGISNHSTVSNSSSTPEIPDNSGNDPESPDSSEAPKHEKEN